MLEFILERESGMKISHNKIHEVLKDYGLARNEPRKSKGESEFESYLKKIGIRHIVGRVNHPQRNGKPQS